MSHALPREWFGTSIRNDGLKREKARVTFRTILTYIAAVALPLGALLFYVWQGLQVIGAGYEIDQLSRRHQALQTERGRLAVEFASLENLATVEEVAVRDLGMTVPGPEQVVVVRTAPAAAPPRTEVSSGTGEEASSRSGLQVLLRKVKGAL